MSEQRKYRTFMAQQKLEIVVAGWEGRLQVRFVIGPAVLLLATFALAGEAGGSPRAGSRQLPRNGLIAYESDVNDAGNRDVFAMKPDGSRKHRLTHGGQSFEPRWSPDGRRIVFVHGGYMIGTRSALWVMNVDGSGKRRLTSGRSVNNDPRWSPDGRSIAFTRGTSCRDNGCNKLDIWLIRPDGTGARSQSCTAHKRSPCPNLP